MHKKYHLWGSTSFGYRVELRALSRRENNRDQRVRLPLIISNIKHMENSKCYEEAFAPIIFKAAEFVGVETLLPAHVVDPAIAGLCEPVQQWQCEKAFPCCA